MESGQAELSVLWRAWVERFSGRRVVAALSFLLIPLIGAVGWIVESPAVGVTAAALVFGCFVFLVAFAMAHREVTSVPAPPRVSSPAGDTDLADVVVPELDEEPPSDGDAITRLAG